PLRLDNQRDRRRIGLSLLSVEVLLAACERSRRLMPVPQPLRFAVRRLVCFPPRPHVIALPRAKDNTLSSDPRHQTFTPSASQRRLPPQERSRVLHRPHRRIALLLGP